ncbi:hypothetical protein C4K20_1513 [Pseudomonas chlororaphis subsp. aurantiaca]|nr:hypothetical protein C4K20_1513 [Pseudomonas chlororaphis subsp. aurantiaca]
MFLLGGGICFFEEGSGVFIVLSSFCRRVEVAMSDMQFGSTHA